MRLKLLTTTAALFAIHISILAQQPVHLSYEWQESPKIHTLNDELKSFPAVYVLHNRFLELRIQSTPVSFFTEHKIIHINSSVGIEQFNKVYIPMQSGQKLLSLEVRSIDPDGNITRLRKENLKELHNIEGYGNFKIFAVEGLTVGGEMEYIYTTESTPQTYGRYILQSEVPVVEAHVEIIYPVKFEFNAKSYNGLPQPKGGVLDMSRRSIGLAATDIPALVKEEYSAHDANRMRIDFKLESNGNGSKLLTWDSIAERFAENYYEPSAGSKIKKLIKLLALGELSELKKVQEVEKYIKTNFTIKEGNDPDYEDTKIVIEKRVGNKRGILKLYMACWEELGLIPQLVICTNRFNGKIDPDFANPADISDVLFYFPNLKQYLSPTVTYLRIGAAPVHIAGARGIFVRFGFTDNRVVYYRYSVEIIEPLSYLHNNLGVKALVSFKEKIELPEITQENFWQGYRAASYRGIYYHQQDKDKEEFLKDVTLSGLNDVNILKREIEGQDVNLSLDPDSYFKVKTNFTSSSLVEQAGEDYLLAVGKLIGKQSELYQEKQRKMDVEFPSISNYNHEIIVDLPDGYTCTGLEAIKIKNEVSNGKEEVMRFHSDYELQGKRLIIKINEVYKVLNLPKENYEAFRKVVNSAADFNKVVLVLHPESSPK